MKTRIVKPELWDNNKFQNLKKNSKYLFLYLITNNLLELTRYTYLPDRRILFDTNLTQKELNTAKKELTTTRLCFFNKGYIYQPHNFAYLDYTGRDRVMEAKKEELTGIPKSVLRGFEEVTKRLVTSPKSKTLNHKPETLIHKPKTINQKPLYSLKWMKENKAKVIEEAEKKFTGADCRLMYDVFIDGVAAKGYKYKNHKAAYFNWIRRKQVEVDEKLAKPQSWSPPPDIPKGEKVLPKDIAREREKLMQKLSSSG